MKKFLSLFLALIMLISSFASNASFAYSATKGYAQDKLESIQKTTGFIPGKTAIVTGNCYAFVSKVCEKLYGVPYSEGLYGNYKCKHESGNYYTVSTLTTGSSTSENIEKVINFFINNAVVGDVVHYGTLTSSASNTSTHTFIIQSIDTEKMEIYHANYETNQYSRSSCHIDTIRWDSWRKNPTTNVYTSSGELYSFNRFFPNRMDKGGMGVTINRYTKYEDKYYLIGAAVPVVSTLRCSTTGMRVKWDAIKGASKYQVQYKKSTDSQYTTATSTCKTTSYDIEGLTTGTTYDFRVRAYIGTKWMAYSDPDSKKVMPPTISAVTFDTDDEGLKMTWGNRQDVTGVRIYRSDTADGTYKLIKTITDNSVSSYVDKTVKYGEKYYYKFERYLLKGSTEYKTTSLAKEGVYLLSPPTVSSYRKNTKTLCFRLTSANAQNKLVYYVEDSKGNIVVEPKETQQTLITVSGLTTGEVYSFYCAATSKIGTSIYAVKQMQALPAGSSSISSQAVKNGIKVSYNTADDVSGYYIYRSTSANGTFSKIAQVDSKKTSSYVDTTVKYNKSYSYKVRRYVVIGGKTYLSGYSYATQEVKNSLSKPDSLTVLRKNPTSVSFKWTKVDNAAQYSVEYKAEGSSWKSAGTTSSNSKVISSLATGKKYYFRVKAVNSIGSGAYSASAEKKVLPPTPSAPKASLKTNGIRVSWNTQTYASGYKIYRAASKNGKYTLIKTIENKKTSSWNDKSVSYGKGYYYKVVCYVKKGKTVYNSPKSAYVYKKYNLSAPKVKAVKKNATSASISWNKVEGASKYSLQYKKKGGTWTTVKTTAASKTISSLKKNTKYYFRVKAVSDKGSSSYSSSVSIQF